MNNTIDFKTAKTIEAMNQKINHMDNAVTDFFNKMSDVLERQFGDDEVYAAVIAPEVELTITPQANPNRKTPSAACFRAWPSASACTRRCASPPAPPSV